MVWNFWFFQTQGFLNMKDVKTNHCSAEVILNIVICNRNVDMLEEWANTRRLLLKLKMAYNNGEGGVKKSEVNG
jgi:hypothetical protein